MKNKTGYALLFLVHFAMLHTEDTCNKNLTYASGHLPEPGNKDDTWSLTRQDFLLEADAKNMTSGCACGTMYKKRINDADSTEFRSYEKLEK